eukprot:SAG31_NODE_28102_length_415_cov_1.117089_1_plen_29_part_10
MACQADYYLAGNRFAGYRPSVAIGWHGMT